MGKKAGLVSLKRGIPSGLRPAGEGLGAAVATELLSQFARTCPLVAAVHGVLNVGDTFRNEYKPGKLTEFFTNFRLLVGPLEIATRALTRVRALSAVFERDGHTRWFEARGNGGHLGIFRNMHALAQSHDSGIVHHRFGK